MMNHTTVSFFEHFHTHTVKSSEVKKGGCSFSQVKVAIHIKIRGCSIHSVKYKIAVRIEVKSRELYTSKKWGTYSSLVMMPMARFCLSTAMIARRSSRSVASGVRRGDCMCDTIGGCIGTCYSLNKVYSNTIGGCFGKCYTQDTVYSKNSVTIPLFLASAYD